MDRYISCSVPIAECFSAQPGGKTNFWPKVSRKMQIGHRAGLPVTAGSVPADHRLSSKGLFFMFELNCPKRRALSTLAKVMIAILKGNWPTFRPISNIDAFRYTLHSLPLLPSFVFRLFFLSLFERARRARHSRVLNGHDVKITCPAERPLRANIRCRDSLLKGPVHFMRDHRRIKLHVAVMHELNLL